MKNVYFKLKLNHHNDKNTRLTYDAIEEYIIDIYKTDLTTFLNQYEIFYNSYNISFMIDNSNNHYLKMQIISPGLNDLLTNKNYQCIYPNCYEMILNIKGSFCHSHIEITKQLNTVQYDKLLKNHADDLKKIYETFTAQTNLYNYFINFKTIDITDFIKHEKNRNIQCILEVAKKTDNMIDIDIPLDLNENLHFKFINDMRDSDDESSFNDSEINLDDLDGINIDINSLDDESEYQCVINTQKIEDDVHSSDNKDDNNDDDNKNENIISDTENDNSDEEDTENDNSSSIFSDSDSGSEIDYKLNKDDINEFLEALKMMKKMRTSEDK